MAGIDYSQFINNLKSKYAEIVKDNKIALSEFGKLEKADQDKLSELLAGGEAAQLGDIVVVTNEYKSEDGATLELFAGRGEEGEINLTDSAKKKYKNADHGWLENGEMILLDKNGRTLVNTDGAVVKLRLKESDNKLRLPLVISAVRKEVRQFMIDLLKRMYTEKKDEFTNYLYSSRPNFFKELGMTLHDLGSMTADKLTELGIVVDRGDTRWEIREKLLNKTAELSILEDNLEDEEYFNEKFREYFGSDFNYEAAYDFLNHCKDFNEAKIQDKLIIAEKTDDKFSKTLNNLIKTNLKSADDYMSNSENIDGLMELATTVALMYVSGGSSAIAKYSQTAAKGANELAEVVITNTAGKKAAQSVVGQTLSQAAGITAAQTNGAAMNAVAFQMPKVAELVGETVATGHVDMDKVNVIAESTEGLFKFGYVGSAISGPLGMQVKGLTTKLLNSKPIINQILTKGITNKPTALTSVLKDISEHSEAIGEVLKFGTEFGINAGYMAYDDGTSYTDAMKNLAQMDGVSKMVIAMLGGKNLEFLTPKKVQQIKTDLAGYKVNISIYEGQKVYSVKDAKGKETVLATPEELFMFILDKEAQKVGVKAETAKVDNTPQPNTQGAREQGEVHASNTEKNFDKMTARLKNGHVNYTLLTTEDGRNLVKIENSTKLFTAKRFDYYEFDKDGNLVKSQTQISEASAKEMFTDFKNAQTRNIRNRGGRLNAGVPIMDMTEGIEANATARDIRNNANVGAETKANKTEYKPLYETKEKFEIILKEFIDKNGENPSALDEESINGIYLLYKDNAELFDLAFDKNNDGNFKYPLSIINNIGILIEKNNLQNAKMVFKIYDIIKQPNLEYSKELGISELDYNLINKLEENRKNVFGNEEYGIDDLINIFCNQKNDVQKKLTMYLLNKGCNNSTINNLNRLTTLKTQTEIDLYKKYLEQILEITNADAGDYVEAVDNITSQKNAELVLAFIKQGYRSDNITSVAQIARYGGYDRLNKLLQEINTNNAMKIELDNLLSLAYGNRSSNMEEFEGSGLLESEKFSAYQLSNIKYHAKKVKDRDLLNKYPNMSADDITNLAAYSDNLYNKLIETDLLKRFKVQDAVNIAQNIEEINALGLLDIPDLSGQTILEFYCYGKNIIENFKNDTELNKLGAIGYKNIFSLMQLNGGDKQKAIDFIKRIYNNEELKPYLETILSRFSEINCNHFNENYANDVLRVYDLINTQKTRTPEEKAETMEIILRNNNVNDVLELAKRECVDAKTLSSFWRRHSSHEEYSLACNFVDLCKKNNVPKETINDIVPIINSTNMRFALNLCTGNDVPNGLIHKIIVGTKEETLKFAEKLCTDKQLNFPQNKIADFLRVTNIYNLWFAEKVCSNKNLPIEKAISVLKLLSTPNDYVIKIAKSGLLEKYPDFAEYPINSWENIIKRNLMEHPKFESNLTLIQTLAEAKNDNIVELHNTLIKDAQANKDLLKSGLEDITDANINDAMSNFRAVRTIDTVGLGNTEAAFPLMLEEFRYFTDDVARLDVNLSAENRELLAQKLTPECSEKYSTLNQEIINLKKQLNDVVGTENLAKIKGLQAQKTKIDEQMKSFKQSDNANTPEVKQQLKEMQKQSKALGAQAQAIYYQGENANQVKEIMKQISTKSKELKTFVQEKTGLEPQDVVTKVRVLSAMREISTPEEMKEFINMIKPSTPENDAVWNDAVNKKIFQKLGVEFDEQLSQKLDLIHCKYLLKMFVSSNDFFDNMKTLVETIKENPELTIEQALDRIPQNIETKNMYQELGIDYDKWTKVDKNSYTSVEIKLNAEEAKQAAIHNLEEDLNDALFKALPNEVTKPIFEQLKEKLGVTFEKSQKDNWVGDGFSAGTTEYYRLMKDGKPITFEDMNSIVSAIKKEILNNNFWTTTNADSNIENARGTLYTHLIKMRTQEVDNAMSLKDGETSEIEIRKTDMYDIKKALGLGNDAQCCTALGRQFNEWSAPTYIMNKCIGAIELTDKGAFVGNTMTYIAYVDGKPALVLDNIELKTKYQNNDKIRDTFVAYAKKLCEEIGQPDLPIYAGPNRHKLTMDVFPKEKHSMLPIGSTGEQEVYLDYDADSHKIGTSEEPVTIQMYKIR